MTTTGTTSPQKRINFVSVQKSMEKLSVSFKSVDQ